MMRRVFEGRFQSRHPPQSILTPSFSTRKNKPHFIKHLLNTAGVCVYRGKGLQINSYCWIETFFLPLLTFKNAENFNFNIENSLDPHRKSLSCSPPVVKRLDRENIFLTPPPQVNPSQIFFSYSNKDKNASCFRSISYNIKK